MLLKQISCFWLKRNSPSPTSRWLVADGESDCLDHTSGYKGVRVTIGGRPGSDTRFCDSDFNFRSVSVALGFAPKIVTHTVTKLRLADMAPRLLFLSETRMRNIVMSSVLKKNRGIEHSFGRVLRHE